MATTSLTERLNSASHGPAETRFDKNQMIAAEAAPTRHIGEGDSLVFHSARPSSPPPAKASAVATADSIHSPARPNGQPNNASASSAARPARAASFHQPQRSSSLSLRASQAVNTPPAKAAISQPAYWFKASNMSAILPRPGATKDE